MLIKSDTKDGLTEAIEAGLLTGQIKEWYEEYKGYVTRWESMNPVRYGYQSDKHMNKFNYLCHRYVADANPRDTTHVFHMFTQQITPEQKRYVDYLCSFDNPYEKLTESATLFTTPEEYYSLIVFDWGKTPSKLATNFLEASRLGSCWGLAELWCYLVDNGVHKDIALALIVYYQWSGHTTTYNTPLSRVNSKPYANGETLYISNTHCNDQPFNSCVYNEELIKKDTFFRIDKFLSRQPSDLELRVDVQPCNYIWDSDKKKSMFKRQSRYNKTLALIKECYTTEKPLPNGLAEQINKTLFEGGQLD